MLAIILPALHPTTWRTSCTPTIRQTESGKACVEFDLAKCSVLCSVSCMANFFHLCRKILVGSGQSRYLHSAVLMNGFMLVFGGNTHNDTSVSQGAKCYSVDFLAYDIGEALMHWLLRVHYGYKECPSSILPCSRKRGMNIPLSVQWMYNYMRLCLRTKTTTTAFSLTCPSLASLHYLCELFHSACDTWTQLDNPHLQEVIARFGHTAEVFKDKMYIFGGFNGQLLSDMYSYTPGRCLWTLHFFLPPPQKNSSHE